MTSRSIQRIGEVCEFTAEYADSHTVEELIDQGYRFIISDTSEQESENGELSGSSQIP